MLEIRENKIDKLKNEFFEMSKKIEDIGKLSNEVMTEIETNTYINGFMNGFAKAYKIANDESEIKDINLKSIKFFIEWCYVNGIDFSTMTSDANSFIDNVINRFINDIEKIEE